MALNLPGSTPPFRPPSESRHYVKPDFQGMDTRAIRETLEGEAERSELHRKQVLADAEESRARDEQAIRVARWTFLVSALTLLVSIATLLATVILA